MKRTLLVVCGLAWVVSCWSADTSKHLNRMAVSEVSEMFSRTIEEQKRSINLKAKLISWFGEKSKYRISSKSVTTVQEELMKYLESHQCNTKETGNEGNRYAGLFSCSSVPSKFLEFVKKLGQGDIMDLGKFSTKPLVLYTKPIVTTQNIYLRRGKVSAYALRFNDPYWRKQWYVQDYRTVNGPVMDLNVVPVYDMGYTGKGVTVAIVDQGIIHNHPDLIGNLDVKLSYDVCSGKSGCEPEENNNGMKASHGTKCAGVVGMVGDNKICGVGIAYESKIIGIKTACKTPPTSDIFAKALVHNLKYVDIYSNSWGPSDDPGKVCVLNRLTQDAYTKGVTQGRNGKGAIYTQSAGNGGDRGDTCATDCFINRPEVIAIGAANQFGKRSGFSEQCTAVFAVTYSGSRYSSIGLKEGVVSTTAEGTCHSSFSGTSAATPLASGIIALTLQANPSLTYRDIMHIIAWTTEVAPIADNYNSWYKNGHGLWVSNAFGFGLMNAENMVRLADKKTWKMVPERHTCTTSVQLDPPEKITRDRKGVISFKTDGCARDWNSYVRFLEHIEISSSVKYAWRGAISIDIISPSNTRTTILENRVKDKKPDGLNGWSIMSVHNWGENLSGEWRIEVSINDPKNPDSWAGYVYGFDIKFHGTYEKPDHYLTPRVYSSFRTPEGKGSP